MNPAMCPSHISSSPAKRYTRALKLRPKWRIMHGYSQAEARAEQGPQWIVPIFSKNKKQQTLLAACCLPAARCGTLLPNMRQLNVSVHAKKSQDYGSGSGLVQAALHRARVGGNAVGELGRPFLCTFRVLSYFRNVNVATNWKRTVKEWNKRKIWRDKADEGGWGAGEQGSAPELNKSFISGCSSSRKQAEAAAREKCKKNKNQKINYLRKICFT